MKPGRFLHKTLVALALLWLLGGCALFGRWEPEYEVQPGDTLYSIAEANGIDYRELADWNKIRPPYRIHPGQTLRLTPPEGVEYRQEDAAAESPILTPPPPGESAESDAEAASVPLPAPEMPVVTSDEETAPPPEEPPVQTASAAPPASSFRWRWPTEGELLSSYAPDAGSSGIDIGGAVGQTVRAAAGGKVVYGGSGLQGYGLLIIVKHGENYLSAYGYNRRLLVRQGDEVHIGQPIAEMGEGPQRRPVLHFEIRRGGKTLDPLQLLPQR